MSKHPTTSAKVIPSVPVQTWGIESCGAGSLSSVLQHYGDTTTMRQWDATLPKTHGGVLSIDLVLAARQKGFDARLITGDRNTVERELLDGRPTILMLQVIQAPGTHYDFFHYVVADGIDRSAQLVRVQFGDGKSRWVKVEKLENAWVGGGHAQIIIAPKDPAADALRAAVELETGGKYADAAAAYETILAAHPDHVIAWTNLGNAEVQLGNRAKAEDAFRKALAIDPTSADALNNLAWLLYQEKRLPEAEDLAHRAVSSPAPDAWMRLDTLAQIQLARGACTDALETWQRAVKDVPAGNRAAIAKAMSDASEHCKP
ncbi:MAG TPA: tetratricopeptide repeat protein [Thermoanaerobaculia bacterium]|nr:tetratricopeptide repeat protein [Thermoanaerobaculia bacterium]